MGRSVTDIAILLGALQSPFGEVIGHQLPSDYTQFYSGARSRVHESDAMFAFSITAIMAAGSLAMKRRLRLRRTRWL